MPVIRCLKNGPYQVEDLPRLRDPQKNELATPQKIMLCRCGKSKSKPTCDGTHQEVGFTSNKETAGEWNYRGNYAGKNITIHDNRGICSHAGYCTSGLPQVFLQGVEPWIQPDQATLKEVSETIDQCPSGALSYSIQGVEQRDRSQEPEISISLNGPYEVKGGLELDLGGEPWGEGASQEHYTLCRCGASKNKPFCDGSHWHAKFRDDDKIRIAMPAEIKAGLNSVEAEGVELIVLRFGDEFKVFSGTCLHQGAKLGEGILEEGKVVCPAHGWAYDAQTGCLEGEDAQCLSKLECWVEPWDLLVERSALAALSGAGLPKPVPTEEEPYVALIHQLAEKGLEHSHGPVVAMGVPRSQLPDWNDLQLLAAQLHRFPLLDEEPIHTQTVIGPSAKKPLQLDIPIFVSDMSFGALSFEAKTALAQGANAAGTGICSGEGGMLAEEQAVNQRYFYEFASGRFGFDWEKVKKCQAFHFKGGQGAKTGVGGHLPGSKVTGKIAETRGLAVGQDAISPARFPEFTSLQDFKSLANEVREKTGGIPIGFKLSAQHVEKDLAAALEIGVDYVILDGRGGGTGAAPDVVRDHISVPLMAALPRARKFLDEAGRTDITLVGTGGLRLPADFVKALALGADAVAISNSAMQAIGCLGARICHTNQCPAGIATQDPVLRRRLDVERAAARLARFFTASTQLMCVLARACGHSRLSDFQPSDLTSWKEEIARLARVSYAGDSKL